MNGITRRVPDIVHTGTYAAGALCSTAEDLITWLKALHGGRVLTRKSYTEVMTPSKLNDGTSLRYSMGLFVRIAAVSDSSDMTAAALAFPRRGGDNPTPAWRSSS
jgi:hypothetical protein